jgi:LPS sulfotransferase NodH
MDHLRYENIVRGLELNESARLRDLEKMQPANRCYIILFTARSGSTWLSSVLAATKRLGAPDEFINPDFLPAVARATNARTADELFASLIRRRKSANLVFGMEARHIDIELIGIDAFGRAFGGRTVFFHLWRDNLVAQGVSLYRAIETGRYHAGDGAAAWVPPYDADRLLDWIAHVADTENRNVRLLQILQAPARHLVYETMVQQRRQTVELFAHALAVPFEPGEFAAPLDGELVKLGDDWNLQAEARLRAERPAEIARFEQARLVKQGVPYLRHPPPPVDPQLAECWQRGHRAGAAGRSPRNNPFPPGSPEACNWWLGWRRGWDSSGAVPSESAAAAGD